MHDTEKGYIIGGGKQDVGTCSNLLMILELPSKRTQEETLVYLDAASLSSNSQIISELQVKQDNVRTGCRAVSGQIQEPGQ